MKKKCELWMWRVPRGSNSLDVYYFYVDKSNLDNDRLNYEAKSYNGYLSPSCLILRLRPGQVKKVKSIKIEIEK